jgi:hypothetical protein
MTTPQVTLKWVIRSSLFSPSPHMLGRRLFPYNRTGTSPPGRKTNWNARIGLSPPLSPFTLSITPL